MRSNWSFQRFAALTAILSFLFAMGNIVFTVLAMPTNTSTDILTNPILALSVGPDGASLLRWGMIFDMFGFYLLLLPIAIFLWRWLGARDPDWVRFYTACGLGYILIGAIGASIFAAVHQPLAAAYVHASAEERAVLEIVRSTIVNLVYGGMWNILEVILAGIWFLGIGLLLRAERRIFSIVSVILGIAALLDSFGNIASVEVLASLGLYIYLLLAPIWALWLGIDLLRTPVQVH
jgi:hypothetical protein